MVSPYDFADVPPFSNRGAQNTYESALNACVDWLQVTFKSVYNPVDILSFLELENSSFLECSGQYGYRNGLTNNGIFIFYGGSADMGVHFQLTGAGCRYIENIIDQFEWSYFFNQIASHDYNVSRVDIALDDFNKMLKLSTLKKKIKSGECISKFRTSRHIESVDLSDGTSKGNTIYFGQPSSRLQIRFYEKSKEMRNKGIEHGIEHWNRYELQLRKERAQHVFNLISMQDDTALADLIKGILNNYIRFANKDDANKNKSRWKTYRPWKKFIGEVGKIKLTKSAAEKDIFDSYEWIMRQAGPTIAMLLDSGITDLNEVIEDGKLRLRDTHLKKIKDYKKKSQVSAPKQDDN